MRIFISPLDWGLGHAARCIPIIRHLLKRNIEVIIGTEGPHLTFLKEHFPHLEFIEFPGYRITYSASLPANVKVLLQLPKMISAISSEYELLNELIETKKIDAVISDNRYGLWNKKIPSVIITHQLNIQASAGNKILNNVIHKHIKNFDECWIPDYESKENLSGVLSHPIPKGINGKYIGPLSRFEKQPSPTEKNIYNLLVILSGPEPQRSKLEELIISQLKELPHIKTLILQGLPGNEIKESGLHNVELVPHLSDEEFQRKVNCSNIILSRPGYSTIMDLNKIGWKKTILIPTPGQTEQEYLGRLFQKKELGICSNQNGFSLKDALESAKKLRPVETKYPKENYTEEIDRWLKKIST